MNNKSPEITGYGTYRFPGYRRSKQFLGEYQIPNNWVDIEQDQEGEQYVLKMNAGKRTHYDQIVIGGGNSATEESKLKSIVVKNNQTGKTEKIYPAGVFIFIGQIPNTAFLFGSGVNTDPWGFIISGQDLVHDCPRPAGYETRDPAMLESSVTGIFAAGDVRTNSTKQVASAAGEGATAALIVREYLKKV